MMTERQFQDKLRPIAASVAKLVPTNRSLLDFVNEKTMGYGMQLSFNKIKFLNKAERSTYTYINTEIQAFKRHMDETGVDEDDQLILMDRAKEILEDAQNKVKKVYNEVRRFIVSSEIRKECLDKHFRKSKLLSDAQNEAIAKEVFACAYDANAQNESHDWEEIRSEFERLNQMMLRMFEIAQSVK